MFFTWIQFADLSIVSKRISMFSFLLEIPDNGYASSWSSSMEQCKNSETSNYLLGDIGLKYPYIACILFNYKFNVFWVGVARQVYTSIDQGVYEIIYSFKNYSKGFLHILLIYSNLFYVFFSFLYRSTLIEFRCILPILRQYM